MELSEILRSAVMSLLLVFVFATILSVIVTVVSMVFMVVAFALAVGFTTMLLSQLVKSSSEQTDGSKTKSRSKPKSEEERIEILKEKYLNGKITEDEFENLVDKELNRQNQRNMEVNLNL